MNDKLTLKMERGRLVLELPQAVLDLEVDGALQAQYFLGRSEGPEDLRGELRKATAARSACAMLRQIVEPMKLPSDKRTSSNWVDGFRHGLAGNHRIAPGPDGMHVPPEECGTPIQADGWSLGYAIRAALAIAETGVDPRASTVPS